MSQTRWYTVCIDSYGFKLLYCLKVCQLNVMELDVLQPQWKSPTNLNLTWMTNDAYVIVNIIFKKTNACLLLVPIRCGLLVVVNSDMRCVHAKPPKNNETHFPPVIKMKFGVSNNTASLLIMHKWCILCCMQKD